MAIPLVASPAPAINYGNLLAGASSSFISSNGNWAVSGGTLTHDTTIAYMWPSNNTGSAKHATTTQNQYAYVAVPGTFKAGVEYVCNLVVTYEENVSCDTQFEFGLVGTDDASYNMPSFGADEAWNNGHFALVTLRWVPFLTRTGVTVRITRTEVTGTGTLNLHIAHAQVYRSLHANSPNFLSTPQTNAVQPQSGMGLGIDNSTQKARIHGPGKYSGGITFDAGGGTNIDSDGPQWAGLGVDAGTNYGGFYLQAETSATGDLNGKGLMFEVGADYVGFMVSELDSGALQFYADVAGGYMLQLRHRGSGVGWSVSDDGAVNGRIEAFFQHTLTVAGSLSVATNLAAHFQMPQKAYVDEVRCHVGTAPTGQALIVDVNDDGTTIFTTQGNRPSIADGGTDATSGTPDGGVAVAKDSVMTVDVDQVGSGTAGADLTVFIRGRYIW